MRQWALFSLALALAPAAPQGIRREAGASVQTLKGTEKADKDAVRIEAHGDVSIGPAAGEAITYTVVRRLRARQASDAERLLGSAKPRVSRRRDAVVLTFPQTPGSSEVEVRVPRAVNAVMAVTTGGNVRASDIAAGFEARTGGGEITLDGIGGSARCISGGGNIRAGSIRGECLFETAGGEIEVREAGGPVRASSAGGGIRIGHARATVSVATVGGPITIDRADGVIVARNHGGPIQIGTAAGVQCESASGAIRMANVAGSLRASTAAGNIVAKLMAGQPAAESFLTTAHGDITVLIPSNLSVTVRAQLEALNGLRRIISEFPGVTVRTRNGLAIAEGAINGGGPELRIAGTGGTITIKKQD